MIVIKIATFVLILIMLWIVLSGLVYLDLGHTPDWGFMPFVFGLLLYFPVDKIMTRIFKSKPQRND